MKIHLERTGGFAGMITSTTVDTKSLSSNEANELRDLIEKCHLFDLSSESFQQAPSKTKKGAADYFTYKITVQNGDKEHCVECNDINMQPIIKTLVNFLVKHGQK